MHRSSTLVRGVIGVAKALTGVERPSPGAVEERRRSCLACPALRFQMCTECKCAAFLKVLVASESCPRGRWERK